MTERIPFGARGAQVEPGWSVDGEPFDAVVVASGRFRKPQVPAGLEGFPRTDVDPDDLDALRTFGWPATADAIASSLAAPV